MKFAYRLLWVHPPLCAGLVRRSYLRWTPRPVEQHAHYVEESSCPATVADFIASAHGMVLMAVLVKALQSPTLPDEIREAAAGLQTAAAPGP